MHSKFASGLRVASWVALCSLAWPLTSMAHSTQCPSEKSQSPLKLGLAEGNQVVEVLLQRSDQYLSLVVNTLDRKTGTLTHHAENKALFPLKDPLSQQFARQLCVSAEVAGFTVAVEYPAEQGLERYALRFKIENAAQGQPRVQLVNYRKERLMHNQLQGGVVADFETLHMRWLGPGIQSTPESAAQGARSELAPVPLKPGTALDLLALPSVFEFNPNPNVPTRY